jgi:hypothetical protein
LVGLKKGIFEKSKIGLDRLGFCWYIRVEIGRGSGWRKRKIEARRAAGNAGVVLW